MSVVTQLKPLTAKQRDTFLISLANGHSVTKSAKAAGHWRQHLYRLRAADADFASDWAAAVEAGVDVLEDEARRRAVEGVPFELYDKDGNLLRAETRYSDKLLELLLKGRRPDIYRENPRFEISGPGGGPIEIEDRSASLADVARVLEAVGALAELSRGAASREVPAARALLAEPPQG